MTPAQIAFLVGIVYFAVLFGVVAVAAALYFARSLHLLEKYSSRNAYHVHLTNTHWIYGALLIDCVFFVWLYATQYQGQGIAVSPDGFDLLWTRWLVLAVVALINAITLTYVMTYKSRDIQSLVLILFAPFAYVALFFATTSQTAEERGTNLFFSLFFYLLAGLAYLFPYNKWRVEGSRYHPDIDGEPWAAYYHRAFYVLLVVAYVAYVLVWVLSDSNELTSVINFDAQAITYLVLDALMLGLFALYMIIITRTHSLHSVRVEHVGEPVRYRAALPLGVKKK